MVPGKRNGAKRHLTAGSCLAAERVHFVAMGQPLGGGDSYSPARVVDAVRIDPTPFAANKPTTIHPTTGMAAASAKT